MLSKPCEVRNVFIPGTALGKSGSKHIQRPSGSWCLVSRSISRRQTAVMLCRPSLTDTAPCLSKRLPDTKVASSVTSESLSEATSTKDAGDVTKAILSAPELEGNPLRQLATTEAFWRALKEQPLRRGPTIIKNRHRRLPISTDFDVCVCGGTLGILIASTLQMRGYRVCIIERNTLEGRTQEWNVNKHEIEELVRQGAVSPAELAEAIETEFNPVRVAFHRRHEMWVHDVLNTGVSPRRLLASLKSRFLKAGGTLLEATTFKSAEIYHDGVAVTVSSKDPQVEEMLARSNRAARLPSQKSSGSASTSGAEIRASLVLDCMGHWSPIVKQMRGGRKPEGICLVVGGCATGIPDSENRSGDFLRTITDAEGDMQLFWEAFPAEGGTARTFYMFCYCDTDRRRPAIKEMLDLFFQHLPEYTGLPLSRLKFKRLLFAGLPSYQDGPLKPGFDRILQIGDASASASPLSFGGFGSMLRHLGRLTAGLDAALQGDKLSRKELQLLQPYQPALSAAWLFQRSMSLKVGQLRAARGRSHSVSGFLPPDHINRLLACNFRVMQFLGDRVLRPFMQDTIRWLPLTLAMNGMAVSDPIAIARVLAQIGPKVLLSWFKHYWAMAGYTILYIVGRPLQRFFSGFTYSRILDALKFGAGLDSPYQPPSDESTHAPTIAV